MNEVIEISDDEEISLRKESRSINSRKRINSSANDNSIEIIDLSVHDREEASVVIEKSFSRSILPSSPLMNKRELKMNGAIGRNEPSNNHQSYNNTNNSAEISAPFLNDLSTYNSIHVITDNSINGLHVSGDRTIDTSMKSKKILDQLMSDTSSEDSTTERGDLSNLIHDLKKVSDKWSPVRQIAQKNTTHLNHGDANENFPKQDTLRLKELISNEREAELPELNGLEHNPQNIFNSFPLSSPSPASNTISSSNNVHESLGENEKMTANGNRIPETAQKINKSPQKTKKRTIKIRRTLSEAGIASNDDISLDVPGFLEDSEDENDSSQLDEIETINCKRKNKKQKKSPTTKNIHEIVLPLKRAQTINTEMPASGENNYLKKDILNLSRYIINGKSFTEEESKRLVQSNLKNNKMAFKNVNQIYRDNQRAREQIILECPSGLIDTFSRIEPNFRSLLEPAVVQNGYDDKLPLIRFLRKCDSIYDFNHDYYFPTDVKILEENEVMLYYEAKEFFELYSKDKSNLYRSIRKLSKRDKHVTLVLHDLGKLKRYINLIEDKKYKERVNKQLSGHESQFVSPSRSKKMKEVNSLNMSSFDIEQRLRFIDREWNVKVHTVTSHLDFIHSLPNLVSLIGKQRMDPALRFMKYAHINVRSANDKTDVLKKTLNEIGRMPELKARGIVRQYYSLQSMFHDLTMKQLKTGPSGDHLMTENMERRVYKLFTCTDPDEVVE